MKGKFITTNIRMAAMSHRRNVRHTDVRETLASVENCQIIWSKELSEAKKFLASKANNYELV